MAVSFVDDAIVSIAAAMVSEDMLRVVASPHVNLRNTTLDIYVNQHIPRYILPLKGRLSCET